jgi:hypothetical protein
MLFAVDRSSPFDTILDYLLAFACNQNSSSLTSRQVQFFATILTNFEFLKVAVAHWCSWLVVLLGQ